MKIRAKLGQSRPALTVRSSSWSKHWKSWIPLSRAAFVTSAPWSWVSAPASRRCSKRGRQNRQGKRSRKQDAIIRKGRSRARLAWPIPPGFRRCGGPCKEGCPTKHDAVASLHRTSEQSGRCRTHGRVQSTCLSWTKQDDEDWDRADEKSGYKKMQLQEHGWEREIGHARLAFEATWLSGTVQEYRSTKTWIIQKTESTNASHIIVACLHAESRFGLDRHNEALLNSEVVEILPLQQSKHDDHPEEWNPQQPCWWQEQDEQ